MIQEFVILTVKFWTFPTDFIQNQRIIHGHVNMNLFIEFIRSYSSRKYILICQIDDSFDLPKNLSDRVWTEPLSNAFTFGLSHLYWTNRNENNWHFARANYLTDQFDESNKKSVVYQWTFVKYPNRLDHLDLLANENLQMRKNRKRFIWASFCKRTSSSGNKKS